MSFQLNFNPSGNYYPTPGGGFGSQREAENYAKQFYPQLFAPPPPPQPQMRPNDPLTDVYPWGSPGYGQAVPWGQPQGQQGVTSIYCIYKRSVCLFVSDLEPKVLDGLPQHNES